MLLLGACTGTADTSTARQAETKTVKHAEHVKCMHDLCVLLYNADLDGDGIPDVDETFIGTDPRDSKSRPTMAQILFELENRELPSFEAGNGLVVTLPTRDAFGRAIFGGDTASRAEALAKLGLKAPDGFDVSRGFTMGLNSKGDVTYHGLPFVVPGGGWTDPPTVIRGMRDLHVDWEVATVETQTKDDGTSESTWEGKEDFRAEAAEIVGEVNIGIAEERLEECKEDGDCGGSKSTDDGKNQQTSSQPPSNDGGDGHDDPEPAHDESCDAEECTQHDDDDYIDPDYMGTTEISPSTIHAILAARGANTDVIETGSPLGDIEFGWSPKDIGNKWGPISLYTPDNDGIAIDPMFVHVPTTAGPDYDPRLEEGLPPADAPPDHQTCMYCFQ